MQGVARFGGQQSSVAGLQRRAARSLQAMGQHHALREAHETRPVGLLLLLRVCAVTVGMAEMCVSVGELIVPR